MLHDKRGTSPLFLVVVAVYWALCQMLGSDENCSLTIGLSFTGCIINVGVDKKNI